MKTKFITLVMVVQFFAAFAQRDPSNEILVFFKEGVKRETKTVAGKSVLRSTITSNQLKAGLSKIGIGESLLEVANPQFAEADTLKTLPNGVVISQFNMTKLFRIKTPKGRSRQELINELNKLPEVLYAEANGSVKPYVIPSDLDFDEQWGLLNTITPGADIHADPAWDIFTGDPNNIIAIIDGGTDTGHEDLDGKISGGDTGFGWGGHGIHVSGIAAAESNNAQGVSGVDWNAQIHAQRIDNAQDDVDTYNAIVASVNFDADVHVLNNSWGTNPEGRYSTTLRQAFAFAYKANRTSVVAMGNHQLVQPDLVAYPAGFENVIAVGATDISDIVANFSVHGNHIDVSAPGVNILSTFTGGDYGNQSGTSMAAPHVSGIVSLLKGFNQNLTNNDIENIIRLSADDLNNPPVFNDGTGPGFDQSSGAGRVNAENALNFLRAPFSFNQWSSTGGTIVNSTISYTTQFLGAQGLSDGTYTVVRHTVEKNVTFPPATSMCQVTGTWGRGVNTTGWNLITPNFGEGFCEVVPGTVTNTGATLRTYIYRVYTILGQDLGYYPTTAANVNFAYSVLGISPGISPITGADPLCSTSQYSSLPMPGSTVSWSSGNTSGLQINSSTGLAARVNNFKGTVTVTATYNNGACHGVSANKSVWVGEPSISSISGETTVCPDPTIYYWYTSYVDGYPSDYYWSIPGETIAYDNVLNSPTVGISFDSDPPGYYPNETRDLTLGVYNECGYSSQVVTLFIPEWCYPSFYSMSPNPASDQVEITIYDESEKNANSESNGAHNKCIIRVFDAYGMPVYTAEKTEKSFTIPTRDFKDGIISVQLK